jgi:hypothetical protein
MIYNSVKLIKDGGNDMTTTPTEHLSLEFDCPATNEPISLAFGYLSNVPMMPIFSGDKLVAMVPRDVLIAALRDGWGGAESGWWVDPANN